MKSKKRSYKVNIFILICLIIISLIWVFESSFIRHHAFKIGLIGETILADLEIKMNDKWYPIFHTEHGRGWIVYLFRADSREEPFKNEPYVEFSKANSNSEENIVTFYKMHMSDELYKLNTAKIQKTIEYNWGKADILEPLKSDKNIKSIYVILKDLQLYIIASDLRVLDDIVDIERVK